MAKSPKNPDSTISAKPIGNPATRRKKRLGPEALRRHLSMGLPIKSVGYEQPPRDDADDATTARTGCGSISLTRLTGNPATRQQSLARAGSFAPPSLDGFAKKTLDFPFPNR
jgi:hypothetical protein